MARHKQVRSNFGDDLPKRGCAKGRVAVQLHDFPSRSPRIPNLFLLQVECLAAAIFDLVSFPFDS